MSAATKRALVEALARGGAVQVHVDTREFGVDVPKHLQGQADVAVKVSHRFDSGALIVGVEYLAQRLTFAGVAHHVRIPWGAVRAVRTRSSVTLFEADHGRA